MPDRTPRKSFLFDKVFGPDAKQIDVYRAVMAPTIAEVMMGYNCTVFTSTQRRSSVFKGTRQQPDTGIEFRGPVAL
ncbi:kinesin-like protein KLP2 [Rhipicephalus microplus]|uniref:kinesin-like protein KLP2 n=1 Tax=Rhipicephalus microplus TaxID=6941 RepID=UPI003F6D2E18